MNKLPGFHPSRGFIAWSPINLFCLCKRALGESLTELEGQDYGRLSSRWRNDE
jgi:hypothetical protein